MDLGYEGGMRKLKKVSRYLYDNLNNKYERKNLYLKDVSILQEEIDLAEEGEKGSLKTKLEELIKNRGTHEYIIKLDDFKVKEKSFLKKLELSTKEFRGGLDKSLPKHVTDLEVRIFRAEKKEEFYRDYVELTYDAELIFKQSKIELEQIPQVLQLAKECKEDLDKAKAALKNISQDNEEKFKNEFEKYKIEEKKNLDQSIKDIKEKHNEGLISTKAKDNTIKQLKREYKRSLLMKSFESETNFNKEVIRNKSYELNKGIKEKIKSIDINVEDLRRNYPIEEEKTYGWIPYATCLLPGLGQALNKQYVKAGLMSLVSLYTYLIAIPYALGFANYQGKGIAGLVNLAVGGGKLDKSIIFMIEGILAIVLVVLAFLMFIASFKDVSKVQKERAKGIRVKSWCETKQVLFEDGVPYLVSAPALVVTIFIVFIPILTTVLLSFTGMDPQNQSKFGWAALENYKMIALGQGMAGSIFWKILGWTVVWTICATTLGVALGFILAIVLNSDRIKGKVIFRSIYLLPWAIPAFITITFFSILSSPSGIFTEILSPFLGDSISIKNDPFVSRMVLICIQAWLGSAYVFLLSTGVLQSISNELYEAADIDGATSIKKLAKITIPMVLFQTAPLLVGQYTFNFNNFSIIYLFNQGGPFNPEHYGNLAGSTDLLISYVYKLTMENQYQAMGAAITMIISIGLMVIAYIGFRNTAAFKREK